MKKWVRSTLVLCIPVFAACSSGLVSSGDVQGDAQAKKYRPVRVETTGSLISRPAVVYVDDDSSDAGPKSVTQTGAKSVSELLNGNTAMQGTNTREFK